MELAGELMHSVDGIWHAEAICTFPRMYGDFQLINIIQFQETYSSSIEFIVNSLLT